MKPRRRTIFKALLLLIAGATLNVAVAWGCAYWMGTLEFAQRGACLGSVRTWTVLPEYPQEIQRVVGAKQNATNIRVRRVTFGMCTDAHGLPMCAMSSRAYLSPEFATNYAGTQVGPWLDVQVDGLPLTLTPWEQHFLITRQIPLRPVWPAFAINTLFYAGVLWVLCCGPFALRRMIRRRRGQCAHCAYPIGQNERCTECGAAVHPKPSPLPAGTITRE